jgi:hypothetical protein
VRAATLTRRTIWATCPRGGICCKWSSTRAAGWLWWTGEHRLEERDCWIGWTGQQRAQRQGLVVMNRRFLVLGRKSMPNLASKSLALACRHLPEHWERSHGYAPVLAETFTDIEQFHGTCYQAAGWPGVRDQQGLFPAPCRLLPGARQTEEALGESAQPQRPDAAHGDGRSAQIPCRAAPANARARPASAPARDGFAAQLRHGEHEGPPPQQPQLPFRLHDHLHHYGPVAGRGCSSTPIRRPTTA